MGKICTSGSDDLADIGRIGSFMPMDIPPSARDATDCGNRVKKAALAFGVTTAPVCALACAQILLAPNILENAGFDLDEHSWLIPDLRKDLVSYYAWIVATVLIYWLLTLTFGRGQTLEVKSANVTLGGSVLTFALATLIGSLVPDGSQLLKWTCPIIGLPDTMPTLPWGTFSFDGQTPCEEFSSSAAPIVLFGLPIFLLVVSGMLRIVLSRRRWRQSVS